MHLKLNPGIWKCVSCVLNVLKMNKRIPKCYESTKLEQNYLTTKAKSLEWNKVFFVSL